MYGGNAFNVSVFGVFVFGLVFVLNVFDVLYVFAFDRFYVIVWQDRHVMYGGNAFNVSGGKR